MGITGQERKCAKSVAESYGGLALALFATALLVERCGIVLFVLGGVSALITIFIYLALFCKWEQNKIVNKILTKVVPVYISHLVWLLGFGALGISLQDKGHTIWGAICVFSGIVIFYVCAFQQAGKRRLRR